MKIFYRYTEKRKFFIETVLEIFKGELKGKKRILIKPNIVSLEKYPTTTHIETIETILSILSKWNYELIVGDGPAMDVNTRKVMRLHVLKDVCYKYGIKLINFQKEKKATYKFTINKNYKLKISKIPFICDYIISLPVLKVHRLNNIGMSCALKNQFGYLSNWYRFKSHINYKVINKYIAGINYIVRTDLFIVDAVTPLLNGNEIRHGGNKVNLGIMYAGKDPVALDSYGLSLLKGLGEKKLKYREPDNIEYIKFSKMLNLGSSDYKLIEI